MKIKEIFEKVKNKLKISAEILIAIIAFLVLQFFIPKLIVSFLATLAIIFIVFYIANYKNLLKNKDKLKEILEMIKPKEDTYNAPSDN